jgi:hypothetical protein
MHECWAHANMQQMIWIVEHEIFTSVPTNLTTQAIRKYFPSCVSCVKGNLSVRPFPSDPTARPVRAGDELVIDIKHWFNSAGHAEKFFSGSNLSLTVTDRTKFMWPNWINNKQHLLRKLKEVRLEVIRKGREVKVIRVDGAFVTDAI